MLSTASCANYQSCSWHPVYHTSLKTSWYSMFVNYPHRQRLLLHEYVKQL